MEETGIPMLVVLEGEAAGQRWPLREDQVLIGRGLDCDIILPRAADFQPPRPL
jgi:hypothetical protein